MPVLFRLFIVDLLSKTIVLQKTDKSIFYWFNNTKNIIYAKYSMSDTSFRSTMNVGFFLHPFIDFRGLQKIRIASLDTFHVTMNDFKRISPYLTHPRLVLSCIDAFIEG
jgi:hypothetical protein